MTWLSAALHRFVCKHLKKFCSLVFHRLCLRWDFLFSSHHYIYIYPFIVSSFSLPPNVILPLGLHRNTRALGGLLAASWMRTHPSPQMGLRLPQSCQQVAVTSEPRSDGSAPRGTAITWVEPTCTLPQTSQRDMVSKIKKKQLLYIRVH